MLKSSLAAVCAVTVVFTAAPAAAQSVPAPTGAAVGVAVGAQAVEHVGALAGIQATFEPVARAGIFAEASWLQDVVARRQLDTVDDVAAYLARTQGLPAAGVLKAPALTLTAGVRLFLRGPTQRLRPYALVEGGVARVTLQPALTLGNADVTDALGQYGVTLGEDVTGEATRPAVGGGIGVASTKGVVTFDVGLRVLSIRLPHRSANVMRLVAGLAKRF